MAKKWSHLRDPNFCRRLISARQDALRISIAEISRLAFPCSSTKQASHTIDDHKHVPFTLFGAHLGNVDVEVADRIALGRFRRRVTLDIRQVANTVGLQAAAQRESVRCGIIDHSV